jgi:hypothetical protein
LFRSWLDQLLQTSIATPSQSILLEQALSLLASSSTGGALSGATAIRLLREAGYPQSILDDLVQSDALRLVRASVELAHEALGDYLRASTLALRDSPSLIAELATLKFDTESMFPVLLSALLQQRAPQQALLRRLARLDLPMYFDALRYRADVSDEVLRETNEVFIRIFLGDMLDGIEEPLFAFFPEMQADILESLADNPATAMAVCGYGSVDWMSYCYRPVGPSERVVVGPFFDGDHIRGTNLRLLGLRADGGRLLGLSQLKDELLGVPRRRAFKGGLQWISERLIGRLRLLFHFCSVGVRSTLLR